MHQNIEDDKSQDISADNGDATFLTPFLGGGGTYREQPWWRVLLEAILATLLSLYITRALADEHAGVISIFLTAAGLTYRFNDLLLENRDNIYVHQWPSVKTNSRTAWRVLAMFIGMAGAYCMAAALLEPKAVFETFGFALDSARIREDSILTRRFGGALALLGHNALVLVGFLVLSFVYWSYGALLSLTWNGCIWGVVLTMLIRRGLSSSQAPVTFVAIAGLAVLPHLLLEALAYLLAALSGIFFSKAVSKYSFSDPVFLSVCRASGLLLLLGFGVLVISAVLESTLAPGLIALLRASG